MQARGNTIYNAVVQSLEFGGEEKFDSSSTRGLETTQTTQPTQTIQRFKLIGSRRKTVLRFCSLSGVLVSHFAEAVVLWLMQALLIMLRRRDDTRTYAGTRRSTHTTRYRQRGGERLGFFFLCVKALTGA